MTARLSDRRLRVSMVIFLIVASAAFAVVTRRRPATRVPRGAPLSGDAIVIGATGDFALVAPLDLRGPHVAAIAAVLSRSSIAVANFELTLLSGAPPNPGEESRWPPATAQAPAALRALGIGALSLANNHATDYGIEGLRDTERALERAGLAHAGTGENLEQARAAADLITAAGPVAFIAVAVSHAPVARAAPRRGDINGRPGLNPLRYARQITLDAQTFNSLKRTMPHAPGQRGSALNDDELDLFGTKVRRGGRNLAELVPNPADVTEILDEVRRARQKARVVVLSVHAHEPGNLVDEVPELLRGLAHAAIDAGADLVVGHGPHRLRGIEIYNDKPVLYSLGNFVFQDRAFEPSAADVFEDSSQNFMTGSTLDGHAVLDFSGEVWWESVIALVHFERGRFSRLELHPIDLGIGQDRTTRGAPRLASGDVAAKILARLQDLSRPFHTTIDVHGGVGVIAP